MGMLITQKDKEWIVGLREKWKVPVSEMSGLTEKLTRYGISYTVESSGLAAFIVFNNSECKNDQFKGMVLVLNELLFFKEKYGKLKEVENG